MRSDCTFGDMKGVFKKRLPASWAVNDDRVHKRTHEPRVHAGKGVSI